MAAKKSLYERAKEWIAIVVKKPKAPTGGIWFGKSKKKDKKLPSREEVKEFLDLYVPEMQERLQQLNSPAIGFTDAGMSMMSVTGSHCLYDWLSYSGPIGSRRDTGGVTPITQQQWGVAAAEVEDKRIAKKPVEVRLELESEPSPWTLEGLDDKIALLKRKSSVTTQHYSKSELDSLVERLENRKKYEEFKEFFGKFPNTTDVLIDALLTKYKLEMKSSDLFVPEFPKEAIDVMEDYTKEVVKLCGKKPVYYVIAEEGDFKKKYEKRDPILLVQSPFGFYYQVLGAWDAEMLILHEL